VVECYKLRQEEVHVLVKFALVTGFGYETLVRKPVPSYVPMHAGMHVCMNSTISSGRGGFSNGENSHAGISIRRLPVPHLMVSAGSCISY
jgi:hypothetical protein